MQRKTLKKIVGALLGSLLLTNLAWSGEKTSPTSRRSSTGGAWDFSDQLISAEAMAEKLIIDQLRTATSGDRRCNPKDLAKHVGAVLSATPDWSKFTDADSNPVPPQTIDSEQKECLLGAISVLQHSLQVLTNRYLEKH